MATKLKGCPAMWSTSGEIMVIIHENGRALFMKKIMFMYLTL